MTAILTRKLVALLAGNSALDSADAVRLASAQRLLAEALEFEDYRAIVRYERDIDFLLRGAVIRLTRVAIDARQIELAEILTKWAIGVPRNDWTQLIALVLTPTHFEPNAIAETK